MFKEFTQNKYWTDISARASGGRWGGVIGHSDQLVSFPAPAPSFTLTRQFCIPFYN